MASKALPGTHAQGLVQRTARAVALAAATLAALGVAACAVGPDYRTPDSEMPTQYQHAADVAAINDAREPVALDTWWAGFQDPVLTKIVERALEQNLDMAASIARVAQARAAANFAGAELLPQGNAYSDVTKLHQSVQSPLGKIGSTFPGYDRNQTLYSVGAAATWEIDIAGGLRRGAEAANAELQAAEANHMGVRILVAAEAADAYFRVRGAQARIAIAQQQVETNQRLLDLVRLRLADGIGAEREQAQAEAQLSQTRVTIPPLQIELETQLNRLDVLMGAQPGTYAAELRDSKHETQAVPQVALAQGPANLLERRPDVIAAERRLAASSARIGVATAEYYPKVSLSALLGFESLSAGKLFTAQAFQPAAAAGLRWRLFDFGRVNAEVALAKGANAEALASYRKSMLQATEDVENALISLAQLESQNRELAVEIRAHERARNASEDAYKGGVVSLYEVLDEDRQLLAARDQQARVQADNARAAVSAFRALGGGWS
ncbi:NodT family efflux transporter outer membrane factor (OMF) lipoprotein [Cupriavidus metallidurans]|jgi:NodT family efflux transporter outer membrane factor (OMF) lipoprotein|uniref:efflux transporter outer membrane subunit n=1 Tax=Cupriavidus TaxID=106589 RepID=UPI000493576F|nr:efflux transporter outer membrane subunit [Cupriavidus metallidurans]KWW32715.1 Toluene efflux pump outer membrane protein TtgI [Cupriavidus metallidurans]MDE4920107.1 efflux transporter outer membrane subunit [Cupriavidus metallidurans]